MTIKQIEIKSIKELTKRIHLRHTRKTPIQKSIQTLSKVERFQRPIPCSNSLNKSNPIVNYRRIKTVTEN